MKFEILDVELELSQEEVESLMYDYSAYDDPEIPEPVYLHVEQYGKDHKCQVLTPTENGIFPKHIAVLHVESGEKRLAHISMGAWMFMNLGDVAWMLNQQEK